MTWGAKEIVVKAPAQKPIPSVYERSQSKECNTMHNDRKNSLGGAIANPPHRWSDVAPSGRPSATSPDGYAARRALAANHSVQWPFFMERVMMEWVMVQ
jgi:hypothetical protein